MATKPSSVRWSEFTRAGKRAASARSSCFSKAPVRLFSSRVASRKPPEVVPDALIETLPACSATAYLLSP